MIALQATSLTADVKRCIILLSAFRCGRPDEIHDLLDYTLKLAQTSVGYDDDDAGSPENMDRRKRRRQNSSQLSTLTEAVQSMASAADVLTQSEASGHISALDKIKELKELYKMKSDLAEDPSQPATMVDIANTEIERLGMSIAMQQSASLN